MKPHTKPDPEALTQPAHFGAVSVLPAERRLLVQGQAVPLGARAFDLLLTLAARRERVVSKDELLDLVWPGLVVEENNLAAQISALRKVLGAQAIATIPGRGYRFTLPAGPAQADPAAPSLAAPPEAPARGAPPPAALPSLPAAPAAGTRVLLADDNKVNRLLLCRTLELQGWQVSTADNGRAALERLRQHDVALLLLDLEMPELDGFGLLQERALDPALRDIPVIVTSSLDGLGPVARCLELGADDYLHKPINAALLKARVGACLERRQLRAERDTLLRRLGESSPSAAPGAASGGMTGGAPDSAAGWQQALVLVLRLLQPPGGEPAGPAAGWLQAQAPEDTLDVLASWHTLMQDALQRHGGQLQQATADSLAVVFGTGSHTDGDIDGSAALQAVRAGLEAAELLALFNAERQAAFRTRKAETAVTEVRGIFAHPDDHAEVKEVAAKIGRRRARADRKAKAG